MTNKYAAAMIDRAQQELRIAIAACETNYDASKLKAINVKLDEQRKRLETPLHIELDGL